MKFEICAQHWLQIGRKPDSGRFQVREAIQFGVLKKLDK